MEKYNNKRKSNILKIALFATGISGIVAEYILSTLASYFIGDAVVQFALIVSTMLFAMGFGSRISKFINKNLLEKFIYLELILSLLVSFCALIVYTTYSLYSPILIYTLSIIIGLLIGLEIPIVTRLNEEYEELKVNVASVLEKDYYGSLVGGLFFAFIGIPFLGITYTPFALGLLNFIVALFMFLSLKKPIKKQNQKTISILFIIVGITILLGLFFSKKIILYGDQKKYRDKIIYQTETRYQKIVITKWDNYHTLFINGNLQLSSFDEYMYHEPLVHTAVNLANDNKKVLILGGGDGCAARELLKYKNIEEITLVDLDSKMVEIAKNNKAFLKLNNNSLNNSRIKTIFKDAFSFLENSKTIFDVIIIDLPDPNNVDLNKLYTKEFYFLCNKRLSERGALITQAGSPYYATKAFYCIEKSMKAGGFNTLPMHNQILTMGEWGWIIGSKNLTTKNIKEKIHSINFNKLNLKWLTNDAAKAITLFGKPMIDTSETLINTLFTPVLYNYYKKGNWRLY